MSATHPLTEFAARKRLLVLQADLHRTLLRAECVNVGTRLRWLNEARRKIRSAGPLLAVGMAAVGLFAAGQRGKLARWLPTTLTAWRAWRKVH